MARTFVTGGTGHIGANLVRALVARGEEVKALVRSPGDRALAGLDVEEVRADLRDVDGLRRAMAGCDRVYHLAALVSLRPGARREMFDVNVLGTKHVMAACLAAGVARVVHCSTFGAVGRSEDGGPSDETCAVNPFDTALDYDLSKVHAELEVHRACAAGLDAVIVNPTGVVGPWDWKPSSVGQTIVDFARRRIPAYVSGAVDLVAMRDVVEGLRLAAERGKTGQRYILSTERITIDALLDELARLTGAPRPRVRLSPRLMVPVAHLSSLVMRTFFPRMPPRFTPGTIALLGDGRCATTQKAQRELGYCPTSVFAALREQYDWFRARDIIR